MIFFKKFILLFKSVLVYVILKILYRNKIKISLVNSIKKSIYFDLHKNSHLSIGRFLMVDGPLYIKCEERSDLTIGNRVFFNHNCSVTVHSSVSIGDGCNFGNNVVVIDHNHKIGSRGLENGFDISPISIGNNVWVGANSTILPGCTIGDGSVVAAGAVVTKSIPPYEIWGGVPACFIKKVGS